VWYVQHHYGAAWYYAPARWRTSDGYAPFVAVVHAYRAAVAHVAQHRISMVRAVALGMADNKERAKHLRDDERLAAGG
jgi:hypothetical protein